MINILLILFAFIFIPILGIPDRYDIYLYIIVLAFLCYEWLRLWRTREVFRNRVRLVRSETKKFIKSFFKEEQIATIEQPTEQVEEADLESKVVYKDDVEIHSSEPVDTGDKDEENESSESENIDKEKENL